VPSAIGPDWELVTQNGGLGATCSARHTSPRPAGGALDVGTRIGPAETFPGRPSADRANTPPHLSASRQKSAPTSAFRAGRPPRIRNAEASAGRIKEAKGWLANPRENRMWDQLRRGRVTDEGVLLYFGQGEPGAGGMEQRGTQRPRPSGLASAAGIRFTVATWRLECGAAAAASSCHSQLSDFNFLSRA